MKRKQWSRRPFDGENLNSWGKTNCREVQWLFQHLTGRMKWIISAQSFVCWWMMINEECFCCKAVWKSSWRIFQLIFTQTWWIVGPGTNESTNRWNVLSVKNQAALFCSLHVKSVIFLNANLMSMTMFYFASYVSHRVYNTCDNSFSHYMYMT